MKRIILKQKEERKEEAYSTSLDFILDNLPLDKFKLDEEAVKQVELMEKIYRILPRARKIALAAKHRMEIVESDLAKKIRKNPKAYGLDKVTDTVVYKETKALPEYKLAFNAYLFAKSKEDEYTILLNAVQERGRQIKYLIEMWLNNYYSDSTKYVTKKRKSIPLNESEDN